MCGKIIKERGRKRASQKTKGQRDEREDRALQLPRQPDNDLRLGLPMPASACSNRSQLSGPLPGPLSDCITPPLRVLRQGPITARAKFTLLIAGVKALSLWFPVTDEHQQPGSGFSPWPPRLRLPVPEMKLFGLFLAQPHLSLGPLPLPFDAAFLPLKHCLKVTFAVLAFPFSSYCPGWPHSSLLLDLDSESLI